MLLAKVLTEYMPVIIIVRIRIEEFIATNVFRL
jgi:hypothetical protein